MQYLLLGVGTILAIFFIIHTFQGEKYDPYVANLDENEFPLNTFYTVGFSWNSTKVFKLKGEKEAELKKQASLLYDPQYADYYANLVWAQMLTLVHLFLTITFLVAGLMSEISMLTLLVGLILTIAAGAYCVGNMSEKITKRTSECESQLPEVVSTMAVLVNSGMVLKEAWSMIGANGQGVFFDLMQKATINMNNGYSDADAIFLFGKSTNSPEIKKFTSALLQSLEKGGGELNVFLAQQSSELWNQKKQKMLQSGEKAATKLLAPIVLIFVGVIIIVMTAAFAGSLF